VSSRPTMKTKIDGEESYLADEYARLKEEKENLDRKRSNANTNEEIRDYNQSLEKLDARIAEYEKRNESFKSELADYNSRLKQVYENQLKKNAGDPPPTDE
jgi:chromosome segregation ATPase